jgi:hypothetical protein
MARADLGELLRRIEIAAEEEARQNEVSDPLDGGAAGPTVVDEKQQLEIDRLACEVQELRDAFGRNRDIHWARMIGLLLLFVLIVTWLIYILKFVYWTGTPANWHPGAKNHDIMVLKLSDPVILALIGATTVNVLGLFYVAARWLYGEKQKPEDDPGK